jgi:hypothetical protein
VASDDEKPLEDALMALVAFVASIPASRLTEAENNEVAKLINQARKALKGPPR